MICDVLMNLMIGLVSGVVSGIGVNVAIKKREEKYQTYKFFETFLFKTFEHCEMYIPNEVIKRIPLVGGADSRWHKAIMSILDDTNPFGHEDKVMSEKEDRICDNALIALEELYKWKKENKIK